MSIKLNYIEKGFGTPIILLHGNGGNHSDFEHQIDFLSKNFRVIAVDTRGHGETERGTEPLTFDVLCDDLKNFLDEKRIKSAIIFGFSDGGNIAIKFALKYPQYIEKLILNGANLYPNGLTTQFLIGIFFIYYISLPFKSLSKKLKRKNELLRLMVKEPNINPNDLKKISVPTLVIAGTDDLIKKKHSELIANNIANSKLIFINGKHNILKSKSVEFNIELERFLLDEN